MAWTTEDGQTIEFNTEFSLNGVDYPSQWLRITSPEEKAAVGLTWQIPPAVETYNARFFQKTGGVVEPKPVEDIRADLITKSKETAMALLSSTDWYYIRKSDTGEEIPPSIQEYRDGVRQEQARLEGAYSDADFDAIQIIETSWPDLGE